MKTTLNATELNFVSLVAVMPLLVLSAFAVVGAL
jgi:hypothetical protein